MRIHRANGHTARRGVARPHRRQSSGNTRGGVNVPGGPWCTGRARQVNGSRRRVRCRMQHQLEHSGVERPPSGQQLAWREREIAHVLHVQRRWPSHRVAVGRMSRGGLLHQPSSRITGIRPSPRPPSADTPRRSSRRQGAGRRGVRTPRAIPVVVCPGTRAGGSQDGSIGSPKCLYWYHCSAAHDSPPLTRLPPPF